MDSELINKIGEYARDYVQNFNKLVARKPTTSEIENLYFEPIWSVLIFNGSDGTAVLYIPESEAKPRNYKNGVSMYFEEVRSLSEILQKKTDNLVKVTYADTDGIVRRDLANYEDVVQLPQNLDKSDVDTMGASRSLIEAAKEYGDVPVVGMGVSPTRRFKGGKLFEALPTRWHIYSPLIRLPNGRSVRQFAWSFADLLWEPERLELSPLNARNDIDVLSLGLETETPQKQLWENPYVAVGRQLSKICDQLEELINQTDVNEPEVQEFLERPSSKFILAPIGREIYARRPLGHSTYIPDFTVWRADGDYHFIEIENPRVPIYRSSDEEQAAHLTHAINQVQDWLRYVDANRDTVRRQDGLETINYPSGEVIAGRDFHLRDEGRRRFDYDRSRYGSRITLRTYDMLLIDAREYAKVILSMKETV